MKYEMLQFVLETQGISVPHIDMLYMQSPQGATIIDPKVPWYERHVHEMGQRFPQSHYRYHPELTAGRGSGMAAFVYARSSSLAGASIVAIPAYLAVTATASYPTVAGPQYQSSMSGQPSIGVDLQTLIEPGLFDW